MSILNNKLPLSHPHQESDAVVKNNKKKLIIAITASVVVIAVLISIGGYQIYYNTKFFPGTKIGVVKVGGLTPGQALTRLNEHLAQIETEGLEVRSENGVTTKIFSTLDTGNPDVVREIYFFDTATTIQKSFQNTHQDGWLDRLIAPLSQRTLPITYSLDEDALITSVNEKFGPLNKPAIDARPTIDWENTTPIITLTSEKFGSIIDYELLKKEFGQRLASASQSPIILRQSTDQPKVTLAQANTLLPQANQLLSTSSPVITYESKQWKITPKQLAPLLVFTSPTAVGVDEKLWQTWLEKNIAPEVVIEAQDAKIEMENGKITNVQAHRDGKTIDYPAMVESFNLALTNQTTSTPLQTITTKPRVTTDTVNDLGIKEIIGVGRSNFKGSPKNRLHNIKTGADRLNGIIIPPGEEFSLVKALGEIDAKSGYLPELVIKGNKTIPEYGGGLCQIGTTTFRAAMASGLPVTERRNHSYSVTYYLENGLPGVDATIYDPKPDFRFQNDTEHHVLIQTRLQGDEVIFEFWGTNDGRVARRTTPKVWGWVSPPPTKIIETTDLAPGEKKCTESAHKGVSASFDYFVTHANGEEKKQTFSSQYKPWQAVCLVGVEKPTEETNSGEPTTETPPPTSSTTEPIF
jgi:vancomycin resistance protein YoaR